MRPRRLRWTAAVLCSALLPALPAMAGLDNGGFEVDGGSLTGWVPFNNVIGNVSAAAITPQSGSTVAKVFGGFSGDPNYSGLFQNHPAFPGQTWTAGAYSRHNTGDSLAGTGNWVVMKIEFYRANGGAYGGPDFLGEESVEILASDSPEDTWAPNTLVARAPAETVEVRIAFVFIQVGLAGGAALIDDVSLTTDWSVIWSDEFDGATVDTSKWHVLDAFLIKNNELQYYAPDDVYIDNGDLVLRSQERWYDGHPYTSGLVESKDRFAHVYGRIEVRAELPGTQGMWPAHWMLPVRPVWPPEIDIMEMIGSVPWRIVMSHHWGPLGPNGEPPWEIGQTVSNDYWGPDYTQGYHTFGIEWAPGRLYWFIDGVLRASSVRPEVPQEPFYLTLNTAVGGDWPGTPDGSSIFPQYHRIDYVRWSVPADPGDPLTEIVDDTSPTAIADGAVGPGEYAGFTTGINSGFGDRIGASSTLHVDSGADDWLSFGFVGNSAWPISGADGVVLYVDSVDGGFASTYEMTDTASIWDRLASGKASSGQRSDFFFGPGFRADYAIVLSPAAATLYELNKVSHVLINAAALDSPTDLFGGDGLAYRSDGGSAGFTIREVRAHLSDLGIQQGGAFDFVVTLLNGDSAYRSNEFVGAAPGNPWDGDNIGHAAAVLKPGDFIRFETVSRRGDFDRDGSIDLSDYVILGECMDGPDRLPTPAPPVEWSGCLRAFDFDDDADVDLTDFGGFQVAMREGE